MVPEGWSEKRLGSVLERVAVSVTPEHDAEYREIGIRSHGKGIFHKDAVFGKALGNKRVFKVFPDCFVVNIVFAWEQAVARTTKKEIGMIASHRFPMYKPKENRCDIDFLNYFFRTKKGKYLLELASPGGAGRNKTLGQKEFANLKFLMPDGDEQTKIAKILFTWDEVIETTEKQIENSKAQKKALMQQLLTGKKRFPGFNKKWVHLKICDVALINPRKPENPKDSRVSFVAMDSVSGDARLLRSECRLYNDVEKGFTSFRDGDVLVAKITPCFENGKGAYVENLINGIGFGSTEFHVIRAKQEISSKLLYHLTNSYEFRVRGEANMQGSAGQKRVPTDYVKSYKFYCPEGYEEQEKIADVLDLLDSELEILCNEKRVLTNQKKALMQQLLTGKRRVKVDACLREDDGSKVVA